MRSGTEARPDRRWLGSLRPATSAPAVMRWLSAGLTLTSAVALAACLLLAAVHMDDRYRLDHVGGARIALARYLNEGILYPSLYDGSSYGGTRFMPLPIVLHAATARLTGEYLVSGKVLAYGTMLALLGVVFVLLRRMRCPLPIALGLLAMAVIGGLRLEQFRVRQDDPELVVQAMKQQSDILRFVDRGTRGAVGGRHYDASLLVRSGVRPGSRHSVSTKIRTEPPAVRTYSTFPLAIQL